MVESLSSVDDAYFSDSSFRLLGLHSVSQPTLFSFIPPIHPTFFLCFLVLIFLTQRSEGGPPVFTCCHIRERYMFFGCILAFCIMLGEHLFGVPKMVFGYNDYYFNLDKPLV